MQKRKIIRTSELTEYGQKCTHCGRYIKGTSENMALYNLSVHINQKHAKNLLKNGEEKEKK